MTRELLRAGELEMVVQRSAGAGKYVLEDIAHREDGRAGVDSTTLGHDLAQLAARRLGRFDHQRLIAPRGAKQRRDESTHAGADHNDPPSRAHMPSGRPGKGLTWDQKMSR